MTPDGPLPIHDHDYAAPSAFTPEALMESVRQRRADAGGAPPAICVLDFDGDLTDWLLARGLIEPLPQWACFHTTMYGLDCGGLQIGMIARTIGGPFAVLVAEQLHASGVRLIVGLTSAGRISPSLPLPCLVVASAAIRDEGASYHYLPPATAVACPTPVTPYLLEELSGCGREVRAGMVWTTDAPYRETAAAIGRRAGQGALAVEMQAASLFAFGEARGAGVATVAMVSNAVDHAGDQFDTGTEADILAIVGAIARAGARFLGLTNYSTK